MATESNPALASLPSNVREIIELASLRDGGIPFRAKTAHVHRTWAGTFTSLPELYIQPESVQEVQKVVRLARHARRRVTTTGCGHSPSDITCTSSWLVNLDNFNKIISVDHLTGLVTVQAGIRLYQLSDELDRRGLALPSLGSINEQSIAGAISTGTHGSSIRHGLVGENITELKITLANGETLSCSPEDKPDLFRAALISLGALGIITEVTFKAVPAFSLAWSQAIDSDKRIFERWEKDLWGQAEFVRIWWFPYMRRAAVWTADVVDPVDLKTGAVKHREPPTSYYDSWLGYYVYHNLLALSRWIPRITPWIEWFVFGMQYGFKNGEATRIGAIQPSQKAFLLNCLYSQSVNEWAIPLHKGPEALQRLGAWLQNLKPGDDGYVEHGIPYSAEGLWVHSPVEVRASDSTVYTSREANTRPFLDPTQSDGPTLYLNAIMYRPYHREPTYNATERYYLGFEWLMRELGGKPHWAKTFTATQADLAKWYGEDFQRWGAVRESVDPDGMFVGPWHRRYLLEPIQSDKLLPLEEIQQTTKEVPARQGGGIEVIGIQNPAVPN